MRGRITFNRARLVPSFVLGTLMLLTPEIIKANAWRVSPLATATLLSAMGGERYDPAAHLKLVSDAIVDAATGVDSRFLAISMPPQHGKSQLITRWTPTWYLGRWPKNRVLVCGYGSEFATDWGRTIRNDIARNEDLLGFGLSQDSTAANRWHTDAGGSLMTAGVNAGITGKPGNLVIVDDPIKNWEEATSSTYRERNWKWWLTSVATRLHKGSVVVLVMTRWHDDDLIGRHLSEEFGDPSQWREIRLPAIWDKDEPDALGRKRGQALFPLLHDEAKLQATKRIVDDVTWNSMYQQVPLTQTGIGSVYYAFDDQANVADVERDPHAPLVWSLDFNVDPMSSVVCQFREERTPLTLLTNEMLVTAEVLDELSLPDSNTPEACEEFHARVMKAGWYYGRPIDLRIYGDVSGNARNTNGAPSDWEIVRQFFKKRPEYRVTYSIGTDNPAVRDRTNAVNQALKTSDGTRRLVVDRKCKELRKDLREVRWKKDSSGNMTSQIDKSDPKRTHLSDALGYFIYGRFRLRPTAGERAGLIR